LSYVILDDDGSKPEPLAAEGGKLARIEVRPSFFDNVSASGQEMIDSFSQVAKRVNTLLSEENQRHLVSALRNLDQASGKVAALATSLEPAAKALPALANDVSTTFRRAETLLVSLNQPVDSFERAARSAEHLSIQGVAVSETVLSESLPRLNVLLEDLQRSSHGLERLLSEINEQPHSVVFGKNPLPPGPGEPGFASQRVVR